MDIVASDDPSGRSSLMLLRFKALAARSGERDSRTDFPMHLRRSDGECASQPLKVVIKP